MQGPPDFDALREELQSEPIVRAANLLIRTALREGATSIHLDPGKDSLSVRFRTHQQLHEVMSPPHHLQNALLGRFKMLAQMDLQEWRVPQSGGFSVTQEGRTFELRASSLPCVYGEKMVLIVRPAGGDHRTLSGLDLSPTNLKRIVSLLNEPSGLLLVTGPQRSGKRTALYACLAALDSQRRSVVTLEESPPNPLPGVNHLHLNPRAGVTACSALRALQEGDADIIMVSHLQDSQTAQMAFRAACARHLVLTSCYNHGAPDALRRLSHMHVEPDLVAYSLKAVWARTLLPRLCAQCRKPEKTLNLREVLEAGGVSCSPVGCEACHHLGYDGLVAVQEVIVTSPELQEALLREASTSELATFLETSMREEALTLLNQGEISPGDYLRAFPYD